MAKNIKTLEALEKVFAQPTAPFREGFVLQTLQEILREHKIPFCQDRWGNIIAGAKSLSEIKNAKKPRLALQAHTDHPGFHWSKNLSPKKSECIWYGGAPFGGWHNSRVRLYDPAKGPEYFVDGTLIESEKPESTREGVKFTVQWDEQVSPSKLSFGAFAFDGFHLKKDEIITRAADDLAGCVIALTALIDAKNDNPRNSGLAIFTRAEEVGFVGCLKVIPQLSKNIFPITLEASRTLPLAEMAQGPVLRIGDRSNMYHSDFSIWMWRVAEEIKKENKQFAYQRRLMDGGTCEASAFMVYNFKASGLAVPLKNYHNQGEDNKPAPEIISLKDVEGARTLCRELYLRFNKYEPQTAKFKSSIVKNEKQLTPLMKYGKSFA